MVRLRSRRQQQADADTIAPDVYPAAPRPDDHGLHLSDEVCARCHRPISPDDEARRTATGGCVHLNC
jgi:hypothetical protein